MNRFSRVDIKPQFLQMCIFGEGSVMMISKRIILLRPASGTHSFVMLTLLSLESNPSTPAREIDLIKREPGSHAARFSQLLVKGSQPP
jgi:hypothetical protein